MVIKGKVQNGVVVLDWDLKVPDGTEVEIYLPGEEIPEEKLPTWAEVFKGLTGTAKGLPSDLAINLDHYLYGVPKYESQHGRTI